VPNDRQLFVPYTIARHSGSAAVLRGFPTKVDSAAVHCSGREALWRSGRFPVGTRGGRAFVAHTAGGEQEEAGAADEGQVPSGMSGVVHRLWGPGARPGGASIGLGHGGQMKVTSAPESRSVDGSYRPGGLRGPRTQTIVRVVCRTSRSRTRLSRRWSHSDAHPQRGSGRLSRECDPGRRWNLRALPRFAPMTSPERDISFCRQRVVFPGADLAVVPAPANLPQAKMD